MIFERENHLRFTQDFGPPFTTFVTSRSIVADVGQARLRLPFKIADDPESSSLLVARYCCERSCTTLRLTVLVQQSRSGSSTRPVTRLSSLPSNGHRVSHKRPRAVQPGLDLKCACRLHKDGHGRNYTGYLVIFPVSSKHRS